MQAAYGPVLRELRPYATLGEMAVMQRGADAALRTATAASAVPTTVLVVPKAAYDAALRARRETSMQGRTELLASADPGAALSSKARRAVAFALTPERIAAGAVLARRGARMERIVLVAEGCVQLCGGGGAASGQIGAAERTRLLERRGLGQMVGEDALLEGGIHSVTIVAETACRVYNLAAQVRGGTRFLCAGVLLAINSEFTAAHGPNDLGACRTPRCWAQLAAARSQQRGSVERQMRRRRCRGSNTSATPPQSSVRCLHG